MLNVRSNTLSARHNHSHGWADYFIHRIILSIILIGFSPLITSTEHVLNVLILKSSEAEVYDTVLKQIKQHLNEQCKQQPEDCRGMDIQDHIVDTTSIIPDDADLIISLGLKARTFANQRFSGNKIINAMIPIGGNELTELEIKAPKHPTLVLDQPPIRSLLLIKYLMPDAQHIGFLYSQDNSDQVALLEKSAEILGLSLVPSFVGDESRIGKQLSLMFDEIDVLLALPDTNIHNRKNVTSILLSTYRNKIPLIGFSAAYVKAGATAAVYSTPDNIGHQIAEIIDSFFRDQAIPKQIIYPQYFSVSINSRVARSLAIQIPAESDTIERLIREAEK